MMLGVNYVLYGCFSARATPGVSLLSLYRSLKLEENIVAVVTQDKMIDDNLCTCRILLITWIFQYISNWSKVI